MWEKEQGILPGHVAAESKLGSTWQLLSHPTSSTNAFNIERSCNPSRATSLNPSRRQHLQEAAAQLAAPLDPHPLNSSSVILFRSKVLYSQVTPRKDMLAKLFGQRALLQTLAALRVIRDRNLGPFSYTSIPDLQNRAMFSHLQTRKPTRTTRNWELPAFAGNCGPLRGFCGCFACEPCCGDCVPGGAFR